MDSLKRTLYENARLGVVLLDRDLIVQSVSAAYLLMYGLKEEDLIGRKFDIDELTLRKAFETGMFQKERTGRKKNDELFPERRTILALEGEGGPLVVISNDLSNISEQWDGLFADPLSDFVHNRIFQVQAQKALHLAEEMKDRIAFCYLDVDNMAQYNKNKGIECGDLLLRNIANLLRNNFGKDLIAMRSKSDEYIFILEGVKGTFDAAKKLDQFLYEIRKMGVTVSVGVSIYPFDGVSVDGLKKKANEATFSVKESNGDSYLFYTEDYNRELFERKMLELNLFNAVKEDEMKLYYQPQVDINTGKVTGVECFLRWNHPQFGIVPPSMFIGIAEDNGFIKELGRWTISESCRQLKEWNDKGYSELTVSVNVSEKQFFDIDFICYVEQALKGANLDGGKLEIEVTEKIIVRNVEKAMKIMKKLKDLGVRISVDDFGTGYTSLRYLALFPIDVLKIDHNFIQRIMENEEELKITSMIVSMAHLLGLMVVAEGVETGEQMAVLRNMKCEKYQGYFISPPLNPKDVSVYFK